VSGVLGSTRAFALIAEVLKGMSKFPLLVALTALAVAGGASAQRVFTFKSAIVALSDDAQLRAEFERTLAAKARDRRYDVVTSYDLVPKISDVNKRGFVRRLAAQGVKVVLMVRPAAIGPGASLDSVKGDVSPEVLADMRGFAKQVSASGASELIAVVHLAIYMIDTGTSELVSAGAVWLDEPVTDRAQGISRLQDLIVENVDAARPGIRKYLGMPPLE
jgi:hypothetical protein